MQREPDGQNVLPQPLKLVTILMNIFAYLNYLCDRISLRFIDHINETSPSYYQQNFDLSREVFNSRRVLFSFQFKTH
jgi:hypothetical protein